MIKNILRPFYWGLYSAIHNLKSESPVFVVGCAHSGTTLMLRILYEHPNLYVVDYESSVIGENYVDYPLLVAWTKMSRRARKLTWVEKTPDHIRYLDKILKTFPKAKIIVMIRDGRDVALSLRNRSGSLEEHLDRWISDNNAWLRYENDERVMSVKLEDFTQDSEGIMMRVCEHIGAEYLGDLLKYHDKNFRFSNTDSMQTDGKGKNHQLNRNWQVNQKIFKSTNRWKTEATPEDLVIFEKNSDFDEMLKKFKYLDEI